MCTETQFRKVKIPLTVFKILGEFHNCKVPIAYLYTHISIYIYINFSRADPLNLDWGYDKQSPGDHSRHTDKLIHVCIVTYVLVCVCVHTCMYTNICR